MDQEIQEMLRKGSFLQRKSEDQFLRILFLVGKKDRGNRPVINLKDLNKLIPYAHFKTAGLFLLNEILLPGDLMCKIGSKDAYFSVPLAKNFQCEIAVERKSMEIFVPMSFFCLSSAPKIFKKLIKIPISLLRKFCIIS